MDISQLYLCPYSNPKFFFLPVSKSKIYQSPLEMQIYFSHQICLLCFIWFLYQNCHYPEEQIRFIPFSAVVTSPTLVVCHVPKVVQKCVHSLDKCVLLMTERVSVVINHRDPLHQTTMSGGDVSLGNWKLPAKVNFNNPPFRQVRGDLMESIGCFQCFLPSWKIDKSFIQCLAVVLQNPVMSPSVIPFRQCSLTLWQDELEACSNGNIWRRLLSSLTTTAWSFLHQPFCILNSSFVHKDSLPQLHICLFFKWFLSVSVLPPL